MVLPLNLEVQELEHRGNDWGLWYSEIILSLSWSLRVFCSTAGDGSPISLSGPHENEDEYGRFLFEPWSINKIKLNQRGSNSGEQAIWCQCILSLSGRREMLPFICLLFRKPLGGVRLTIFQDYTSSPFAPDWRILQGYLFILQAMQAMLRDVQCSFWTVRIGGPV